MANAVPLVSVAMATYNGEKYITEQIESILNQSSHNIELVITDDASNDDTVPIIRNLQQRHANIILFENKKNLGVTKTFENSIRNCSAGLIAISDQDDIWDLQKIELLQNEIGSADVAYANSVLTDSDGVPADKSFKSVMSLKSYYSAAPFLLSNCLPGHAMLMKKEFIEKIMPFPDGMMYDRWISFNAAGRNGAKYVDRPLVRYRQHETNTVGVGKSRGKRKSPEQKFDEKLAELRLFEQADISDQKSKLILKEMLHYFHRGISLGRMRFFLRNFNEILTVKSKSTFKKLLFCLKMFFKPNY